MKKVLTFASVAVLLEIVAMLATHSHNARTAISGILLLAVLYAIFLAVRGFRRTVADLPPSMTGRATGKRHWRMF